MTDKQQQDDAKIQEIQITELDKDDPLEKILGVFDDDITDLSTTVRETMDQLRRKSFKRAD